jgi:hypothetical protein
LLSLCLAFSFAPDNFKSLVRLSFVKYCLFGLELITLPISYYYIVKVYPDKKANDANIWVNSLLCVQVPWSILEFAILSSAIRVTELIFINQHQEIIDLIHQNETSQR